MRIWTDGFELGDLVGYINSSSSVVTTTPRSGNRCAQIPVGGAFGINLPPNTEYYFRLAFRFGTVSPNNAGQPFFQWVTAGGIQLGGLKIASGGSNLLQLVTGTSAGTVVATGTTVIQPNTWYLAEVHVLINSTTGEIQLKLDGVDEATFNGNTLTSPIARATYHYFGGGGTVLRIDDIAINDPSGGEDDLWCGDGKIILLTPEADGDKSEWMGSDSDQINNYLLVDEIPSDGDSTYVVASGIGVTDLYHVTDFSIPNADIISVQVEGRARSTVAEGDELIPMIKTGGVEFESTPVQLLTAYSKKVLGTRYTTNPDTDAAWTVEDLNSLQIGQKVGDI